MTPDDRLRLAEVVAREVDQRCLRKFERIKPKKSAL